MNSRRGFFRSLAQTAAIIALAPQLAFRVRPEVVDMAAIDLEMQRAWVNTFFFVEPIDFKACGGIKVGFIEGEWKELETITTYAEPNCNVYVEAGCATPEELKKLYGV